MTSRLETEQHIDAIADLSRALWWGLDLSRADVVPTEADIPTLRNFVAQIEEHVAALRMAFESDQDHGFSGPDSVAFGNEPSRHEPSY